ncbi:MAG: hypothetical protein JWR59_617 [Brevundimonas sp.]|nr:hypothetical protein [Brevundimonas sp.]
MADTKISDLSAASALTGAELIEAVQGGGNVRTTAGAIAALAGGGPDVFSSLANFNATIPAASSTTVSVLGSAVSAIGTATPRSIGTSNYFTRQRRIGYVSSAGSGAGINSTQDFYRDGGVGLYARFGIASYVAGMAVGVGIGMGLSGTNFSLNHQFGFGKRTDDTNMQLLTNNGGTANAVDLGANFPANTGGVDWYEALLLLPPGGAAGFYRLRRLNTGHMVQGTTATQLPAGGSQFLTNYVNCGGSGSPALDVGNVYTATGISA